MLGSMGILDRIQGMFGDTQRTDRGRAAGHGALGDPATFDVYSMPSSRPISTAARAAAPGDLSRLEHLDLPPGRLVYDENEEVAIAWATTELADYRELWRRLVREFPTTGLWPITTVGLNGDLSRPWGENEFEGPQPIPDDVVELLRSRLEEPDDQDEEFANDTWRWTWGGLTPAVRADINAPIDVRACREPMLVLVPVTRPADVPAALGWEGPANHDLNGGDVSTVLRSWEDRFGAVLVSVGFDTITLDVANPPRLREDCVTLAGEHYLFCPDNIDQSSGDFDDYVELLLASDAWSFWWD